MKRWWDILNWGTFSEEGGGSERRYCSARYAPQPAAAHKCPMLRSRAVWGTNVSWEEGKGGRDKTGGGTEPESRGGCEVEGLFLIFHLLYSFYENNLAGWTDFSQFPLCVFYSSAFLYTHDSLAPTLVCLSVRLSHLRISILSASLNPHKEMRQYCGGQNGG